MSVTTPTAMLPAVPTRDLAAAAAGARAMLTALGVDLTAEGLVNTPDRVARALAELLTPRPFDVTTFPNDERYEQLVIERRIPFWSLCEHHFLPFYGHAYLGYLPGDRVVGLSKLARVVELFARQPQVQERLTQQIANWIRDNLDPRGVGVVMDAEHMCMTMRGAHAVGSRTRTSALHGTLREDARAREEFFALAAVNAAGER